MLSKTLKLIGLLRFLLPLIALPGAAFACADFSKAPNSRWRLDAEDGFASLLTPCGDRFFSLGVNGVDGGSRPRDGANGYFWSFYEPTLGAWARRARERLLAWGFNTAGAWSFKPQILDMPSTIELSLGRRVNFMWGDPFDPALPARVRRMARKLIAPYKKDPRRIGYFSDNEIGWWNGPLFSAYTRYSPRSHTKQRLIRMLRERYGDDWQAFRRDFTPPENNRSFDDLLRETRTTTRMRPGGQGFSVVREWTRIVAEHYYRIMREAILTADPEALYLGDRLPIYYDPDAVRVMGSYVDVIATNYNVDAPDGWIAQYYFAGLRQLAPKPVLVTEWFFAAHENRTGNLNRTGHPRSSGGGSSPSNNVNRTGHLMTVTTQDARANGAAAAAEALAREGNVVGLHWFQLYDHPKGGRADGEDYNFGLLDVYDRPYEQVVAGLGRVNRLVLERRNEKTRSSTAPGVTSLPYAAIDAQDGGLGDWPKAVALISMQSAPDEPIFGDVYLSWDDDALNVAVIAMDYYDPHLMAWTGTFPREEAFRLDLGVRQRGQARSAQLRVIPKLREVDTGKLEFHVDACRVEGTDCLQSSITASYFGIAMDQPRVIFEAKVPWTQFGGRPVPGDEVGLAIAMSSFHRSRWMSLSGEVPDQLMKQPSRWRGVILGPPPSVASPSR
jgi:hypothetical protein